MLIQPQAIHSVLNLGANIAGAINYAEQEWDMPPLYRACREGICHKAGQQPIRVNDFERGQVRSLTLDSQYLLVTNKRRQSARRQKIVRLQDKFCCVGSFLTQMKPIESNYAPSSQSISSRRSSAPKFASRIYAETDPERSLQVETPPEFNSRLTSRRALLDAELVPQPQFQLRAKRPRSSSSIILDIRDRQSGEDEVHHLEESVQSEDEEQSEENEEPGKKEQSGECEPAENTELEGEHGQPGESKIFVEHERLKEGDQLDQAKRIEGSVDSDNEDSAVLSRVVLQMHNDPDRRRPVI